jgi:sugar phosphate isomerase/epimerase
MWPAFLSAENPRPTIPIMYSFSTCWNSGRHTDGRAMLREIRELGFDHAELSHGIRISLMPGILEAVDAGEMKISTLHNFCPLPVGITHSAPNLYEFSAARPRDRELAIRHTLRTFEFAERVKAPVVVLHLGSMDLKDYTGRLGEMLERGQKGTPKYEKFLAEAVAGREAAKRKFFEHTKETLRLILPEAQKRGLKLGCENREAVEELPLETDFPEFFFEFGTAPLVYWHDTGHAQIKENLGFIRHAAHLEALAGRLAGFHIHDVQFPVRDHCAPGTGTVDFAALQPFVKPEHIKVFEFSNKLPVEAARAGIAHVKALWGGE